MVRYNPDPFVGPAVSSRGSFYSASGRCVPKREKGWFKIGDAGLQVLAFKLANLNEIWDSAVHGSIPTSWLRAVGWRNARIAPPEELWRTLVADRTSVGLDPEPGYSSIIQSAALEKGVQYGINTNEFIREKDNAAYYEVFRRVEAVVWSRKLVRAGLCGSEGENKENKNKEEEEKEGGKEGGKEEGKKDDDEEGDEDEQGDGDEQGDEDEQGGEKKEEKWEREAREEREEMEERREKEKRGSLGLVPAETEITDGIYIVQGCSVPLVLRQTGKQQEGRETYKLIGECYINNMMDGEAMIGHPGWVGITLE
ncbi:hypothetical protein GQX73_g6562 [Xylaria multiplex]|uniref:Uncharacterized protein n=1 Tax=Xylaria multiplex TaxID=323545 RepID=A0A7C8ILX4_9PEZI|nr:hypothetical protein GQX73_g6562 [Xylaria multiplex]